MPLFRAIGLMSGTSMDGVDVALIETDGMGEVRQGPTFFQPYAPSDRLVLREALAAAASLQDRQARPEPLAKAEALVTSRHAEAVETFLETKGIDRSSIDLVGFHGQTVLHRPEQGLTVQIGSGEALASRLRLPVAHDFRAVDVAAGGQGAPLVPVFHQALAESLGLIAPLAFVNIGGVANLTFINLPPAMPVACDTGPGNALIDDLMLARTGLACDRDGAAAASGRVDEVALCELLQNPFFARPAPKSLDRNAFSLEPVAPLSTENAAATLVAFTVRTIADALERFGPLRQVVVCGGGARNPAIMEALAERLACPVDPIELWGWPSDFLEAQAFAYLAARVKAGLPLTFPTTTGVGAPLTGGLLAEPEMALSAQA